MGIRHVLRDGAAGIDHRDGLPFEAAVLVKRVGDRLNVALVGRAQGRLAGHRVSSSTTLTLGFVAARRAAMSCPRASTAARSTGVKSSARSTKNTAHTAPYWSSVRK